MARYRRLYRLSGLLSALITGLYALAALADDTSPGAVAAPRPFADSDLRNWEERSFEGNSRYELVEEAGLRVLQASTEGQASVLYREQSVDLGKTPWMSWSWKIQAPYPATDERAKSGDDFPARLYVAVKTGVFPWQTLALNYVWSSSNDSGDHWPNPFTSKAHMIVVNSGGEDAGQWTHEQRNLKDDFQSYFGVDIGAIDGYAVMVDGDNTGVQGRAWFGAIEFTSEAPVSGPEPG